MTPLRIGVIGCGNISGIYFENLGAYKGTEVVACADLDLDRAKAAAEKYGVTEVLTPDALISHPDVELVLNLTIPKAHGPIALQALEAGKHVYNEKPLSANRPEAEALLRVAAVNNLLVGCAPDTFLGAGIQTCRKLIDDGAIGTPVAAQAAMLSRGPENWHPAPEFFFKPGGGPMLDMGPYYITALVNLLGCVKRVTGSVRVSFPERPISRTNEGFYGRPAADVQELYSIAVETPTHLAGVMDMESGAIVELTTSFDVYGEWHKNPITVYGAEGTLKVPDPNGFGGPVLLKKAGQSEWTEITPLEFGFEKNSRGVGVLDMAESIRNMGTNRASGALAYHVLDVMLSFQESSDGGVHILPISQVPRPAPMAITQFAAIK
jgi:predicted dehydrogenase